MAEEASKVVTGALDIVGLGPTMPGSPPTPPVAPGDAANEEARRQREAAEEEARRRSIYGRSSTNPTGALGDTSTPNLASKSLLGI